MNSLWLKNLSLLFALTILLSSCEKKEVVKKEVVSTVKIFEIKSGDNQAKYNYPGKVKAADSADLSFALQGRVVDFPVKEGYDLNKGDLVAKLDQRDFISDLKSANAEHELAETQFKSYEDLVKKGFISVDEFNQKKRNLSVSLSDVRTAEKALEDSVLKAPFDGSVGKTYIDNFQDVRVNQPIIQFQNLNMLDILVDIPERDVVRGKGKRSIEELAKKIDAVVAFATLPEKEFHVTLKEFGTIADEKTQTYPASFTFKKPKNVNIMPGMTATIIINPTSLPGEKESLIFVPINSVFADPNGKPHVWIVDSATMTVSKKKVEVGDMKEGKIKIISGVKKGDKIVASGLKSLSEGSKIREYKKFF